MNVVTSGAEDGERRARVMLSFLADPGDPVLGAALRARSAAEILALTTGAAEGADVLLSPDAETGALVKAMRKWRRRLSLAPTVARLAVWQQQGLRIVTPADPEWPSQLDDLGDARPLLLWVQGSVDLRFACLQSVSVVGARAATAYGTRVGLQLAVGLAERGVTVVSGGAYATNTQLWTASLRPGSACHTYKQACQNRSVIAEGGWRPYSDDDRRNQLTEFAALCRAIAAELRDHGDSWPASLFEERAALAERLLRDGYNQRLLNEVGARFRAGVEWLNPKALDFNRLRGPWQSAVAERYERAADLALDLRAVATAN